MIRVVQFDQYISGRPQTVAFYNTVSGQFMNFGGEESWGSWDDLTTYADSEFLDRVKSMCPLWFFEKEGPL